MFVNLAILFLMSVYSTQGNTMNTYLMLGKLTEKALSSIDQHSERITRFKQIVQEQGAKVVSFYLILGKYDLIAVLEAPNDDVMARIALIVGKRGNARTITMRAFDEKEQNELIGKLSK